MVEEIKRIRERIRIKPRILTMSIMLILGLVIGIVPENTTQPFRLNASDMLAEVQFGTEMISPDEVADWLVNRDPSIQLIDVRTPAEYDKFHLDNAINIPLTDILSDEWRDYVDQGVKMNIFYANGTTSAHKVWMILRQLGYENNYVLQGGLNYWVETILNPTAPASTSPDDEIALYDFRKGAGQFFGGAPAAANASESKAKSKPPIKRRKKKKAPEGGC